MATPETIGEAIEESAKNGVRSSLRGNGQVMLTRHALPDQIAADNHVSNSTAAGRAHLGIRFVQLIPPAAGGHS